MAEITRPTRINLNPETREVVIDSLNSCLANTLYAQLAAKFAHWNVKGVGFFPAHKLFDQIYEFYEAAADTIGERITALGGTAEAMVTDVAAVSTIAYGAGPSDHVSAHMEAMANMLGQVLNQYRAEACELGLPGEPIEQDLVTQNMLLELTQEGDKQLYFLEADRG